MDDLKINEDLSPKEREMIKEYWALTEDGIFARIPKLIAQENNITLHELQKIVIKNSVYTISVRECKGCNAPLQETVTSRSNYKVAKSKSNRECEKCKQIRLEEEREFFRKQDERIEQCALKAAQIKEIEEENYKSEILDIGCNYEAVLNFRIERNLSWEDLKTLVYILKYRTKDQIYTNLFDGNSNNKVIWDSVKRLQYKNLIQVQRENQHVIDFIDPLNLYKTLIEEEFILNEVIKSRLNVLSNNKRNSILRFSLQKAETKFNNNQPDYRGTFSLKQEIVLQEGVKYIYGGWINDDGSIGLNFQPYNEYWSKRTNQGRFEDETDDVKKQILNLRNDDEDPLF